MGVDCVTLIGMQQRPADTGDALRELDALNPRIADWWPSALPGYRTQYNPDVDQPWRVLYERSESGVVCLAGSRDLELQVYRRAVIYVAEPPWRTFLAAAASREFVRRICRAFADVFGGDRIIYVPDGSCRAGEAAGLIQTGESVATAEDWLVRTCGPPKLEWNRLAANTDPADGDTYYVDRLSSFS